MRSNVDNGKGTDVLIQAFGVVLSVVVVRLCYLKALFLSVRKVKCSLRGGRY